MPQRNTAIRGVQIRDGEVGADQLSVAVNASLALADSALQSIGAGSITETELSVSVNASLDLADSALQSIGAGSITETELSVSVNASLDLADSALQAVADEVGAYTGNGLKVVRVNTGGTALEYATLTDLTGILEGAIKVEDLTGNADTSLTLANAPVESSLQLYINGLLQQEGSGKDYVISGTSITLAVATVADDIILAHYVDAV